MGRPIANTIISGGGNGSSSAVIGPASATDNAIVRYDGTTGKLVQDSAVTVSDVAANVVTVATTTGNALALVATAPAATTGASQVGKAFTANASNAVASTDTAGAAAGGAVTITSGNAARNASGNANGGDIALVTGTGIGTGTAGNVTLTNASLGLPDFGTNTAIYFTGATTTGIWRQAGTGMWMREGGGDRLLVNNTQVRVSGVALQIGSSGTGLSELAAGVTGFGTGAASSVAGYYQFAGGKRKSANQTVTDSTTLTDDTVLTCTVASGRSYTFRFLLYFTTVNTSGVKVAVSGTATHTAITYDTRIFGVSTPALLTIARATAKDTAAGVTATGTAAYVEITGSTTINAGGTLLVQFAQNAETGAAESVINLRGSSMEVLDMQ